MTVFGTVVALTIQDSIHGLYICSIYFPESAKWKTSLSLEKLKGMKCVQDIIKKSEVKY